MAALNVRDLLDELGLPSWIKTTGSKGFHIAVPLDGKSDFGTVARFAHVVGKVLVSRDPEHLTQEFSKVDRGWSYSCRYWPQWLQRDVCGDLHCARQTRRAVSAPCTWEEIESGEVGPRTFTLRTMTQRIADVGDLWADMLKKKRSLARPIERLKKLHKDSV